jgi:hypothetical protein
MLAFVLSVVLAAGHPTCRLDRDVRGRIHRSASAKSRFRATHPCPATGSRSGRCTGYVIDHVCPLACCGADAPSNMQWQTRAEAKAKDAWERDCSSCSR